MALSETVDSERVKIMEPKSKSEALAEFEFRTLSVSEFRNGDVKTLVAYQSDKNGRGRLALVDTQGGVLAHSFPGVYQHPMFATFGTQTYVAYTKYFDGEPARSETVYRLEEGVGYARNNKGQKQV